MSAPAVLDNVKVKTVSIFESADRFDVKTSQILFVGVNFG